MKMMCLLSENFEDLEAIGTVTLLRRLGIQVDYISVYDTPYVKGSATTEVKATKGFSELVPEEYDGLFIPGGRHSFMLKHEEKVLQLVRSFDQQKKWIMAICAAPIILKQAGIMNGVKYISFPSVIDQMDGAVRIEQQSVRDGHIITGIGAGAIYEFAFEAIKAFSNEETVTALKNAIMYHTYKGE